MHGNGPDGYHGRYDGCRRATRSGIRNSKRKVLCPCIAGILAANGIYRKIAENFFDTQENGPEDAARIKANAQT